MSEDWDSYLCNVNDKLASIRVDLGIRSTVPDLTRSWLLWVWVYFKRPRPDGLSSHEEFDELSALEDTLQAALEEKCGGVLSGCITTSGRREFYFYGSTSDSFEEAVNQSVALSHGYKFDCDKQEDLAWGQYLNVLYPSDEQRQLIENRRLMDLFRSKGDKLESARDVRHWAYFKSQTDRRVFRDAIEVLGYRIEFEKENPSGELRYGICMVKRQEMTSKAVDDAVTELFRASRSAHGEYNGWECQLVVDAAPNKKSVWKWW
jgi:hypothetical protein